MLTAIDLNHQRVIVAVGVYDVRTKSLLAAEFGSSDPPIANLAPE